MMIEQMELGIGQAAAAAAGNRRQRRSSRANWWFERMRALVDRAYDWEPAPEPRPEQTWMAGANRQVAVAPGHVAQAAGMAEAAERQVCE